MACSGGAIADDRLIQPLRASMPWRPSTPPACIATSSRQTSCCGRTASLCWWTSAPRCRSARALPWKLRSRTATARPNSTYRRPGGPWTDVYGLGAIAYRAVRTGAAVGGRRCCAARRCRSPWTTPASAMRRCAGGRLGARLDGRKPQTVEDWRAALSISVEHRASAERRRQAQPRHRRSTTIRPRYGRRTPKAKVVRPSCRTGAPRASVQETTRGRGARGRAVAGGHRSGRGRCLVRAAAVRALRQDRLDRRSGRGGDTLSIADAIARARAGATIAIRPGTYAEGLTIERPINLVPAVPEAAPDRAEQGSPAWSRPAAAARSRVCGSRGQGIRSKIAAEPLPAALELEPAHRRQPDHGRRRAGHPGSRRRHPEIAGNTIENGGGPGIVVAAGAAPRIANNTIKKMAQSALIVRGGRASITTTPSRQAAAWCSPRAPPARSRAIASARARPRGSRSRPAPIRR